MFKLFSQIDKYNMFYYGEEKGNIFIRWIKKMKILDISFQFRTASSYMIKQNNIIIIYKCISITTLYFVYQSAIY